MPCFKPLKALDLGKKQNGKKRLQFVAAFCKENNLALPKDEEEFERFNRTYRKKIIDLPCGQCLGCRLEYSRQWAIRCMEEAKLYEQNIFLTLSYNDKNLLKFCQSAQLTSREIIVPTATLVKTHMSEFMKDLRAYWQYHFKHDGIRFFGCGEYGEIGKRPHYHIAIFNIPLDKLKDGDVKFYKFTEAGEPLYTCKTIENIWGKGFTPFGEVTWNSAAYIARYVTKKIKGAHAKEYYEKLGVIPEFTNMSRRPGIGAAAMDKLLQAEDYETAKLMVKTNKGIQTLKPARYYDKLYDNFAPEDMERVKAARKLKGETAEAIRQTKTSTDEFQYRQIQEENLEQRIKILSKRDGIE